MKLSKFWGHGSQFYGHYSLDSQKELLEENKMLRELITETLTEVENTQVIIGDFIERLDSILNSVEKISDGTE